MIRRFWTRFFADVLPPFPTPPAPVLFEFTGLQKQLEELNTHLAELVRIEQRRERQVGQL